GVFRCTEGLQKKYGSTRVFDTPISEGGIVGVAVGMGAYGLRPVAEIQFADYFYPASDQLVSEAARLRYRSAGDFTCPITLRMPCGGGIYGARTTTPGRWSRGGSIRWAKCRRATTPCRSSRQRSSAPART